MKKTFLVLLMTLLLAACSQGEDIDTVDTSDEAIFLEDVKVPNIIFTSDQQSSVIDEDEIKSSIKLYLDSFEDLLNASEPFEDKLDEDEELSSDELEKLNEIYRLMS